MPLCWGGCSGGLWAAAVLLFLALPFQYHQPHLSGQDLSELELARPEPADCFHWISLEHLSPFHLLFTTSLLLLAVATYLWDWIQRKLMERRLVKLKQYLTESVERLRVWDARQERLEGTLGTVRAATQEYNLLLFLLLRRHHRLGPHKAPPSHCFFDKELDDLDFRNPTIDL